MPSSSNTLEIRLPEWLEAYATSRAQTLESDAARMAFVVGAARRNVESGGGPFAAAVFEEKTGALVSLGVNLVTRANLSMLHAEIVALAFAQARLNSFDLGAAGAHALVSSAEPCAMCLGAVTWSGVNRLVIGARRADVEACGFEEGARPSDWAGELCRRGVAVTSDIGRTDAAEVIADYARAGGLIYNPIMRP